MNRQLLRSGQLNESPLALFAQGFEYLCRSARCVLFDQAEIQRWEEQLLLQPHGAQYAEDEYVAGQRRPNVPLAADYARIAAQRWPERRRLCPMCRQMNVKVLFQALKHLTLVSQREVKEGHMLTLFVNS